MQNAPLPAIFSDVEELDIEAFERALARSRFLAGWFRASMEGIEHIPTQGGAILVSNHGHFAFDLSVLVKLIYERTGRPVRALADHVIFKAPGMQALVSQMGVLEGTPENALSLLTDDQLVLVYPGGAAEALKKPEDRYKLLWERATGFVRVALLTGVPVIPIASVGTEEMYVQLATRDWVRKRLIGKGVARFLGEKYVFPIYAGFGAFPLPVRVSYVVGKPIQWDYGPEAADDEEIVRRCHQQAWTTTQRLLDESVERHTGRVMQAVSGLREAIGG